MNELGTRFPQAAAASRTVLPSPGGASLFARLELLLMPQTGFTPIQLYNTATPAAVPLAINLVAGELALNRADGNLFFKDSSNVVRLLASTAAATGTVSSINASGGTTGLTFTGGPITTSGTLTLGGTLAAANGGTGLTSPGASGNVLTSTGTGWTSAPAPSGKWELISTAVASTTTNVDFTGLSNAYSTYRIVARDLSVASGAFIELLTSTNNGVSFASGATDYGFNRITVNSSGAITAAALQSNSISLGQATSASSGSSLDVSVFNAGVADYCTVHATGSITILEPFHYLVVGARRANTAVNAVRLTAGASNLNGTFYLYGLKV